MNRLYIGKDPLGNRVYLTAEDFETHFHICGLSRSGKSRLVEHILREFITYRIPFVLIDPAGELYRNLLHWLAYMRINRPILLLDPSYERRIVGFNPFQTSYTDEARITTKASRMVTATVKVWGVENTDNFGNIERWLGAIYYVILEQGLTVADIPLFTIWDNHAARNKVLNRIRNEEVKTEMKDFYNIAKGEFKKDILSTRNKLRRFTHPQMQRVMGLKTNNIDLSQVIEGGHTLLVNLQAAQDDLTGYENNRTLGALLISEIWELFRKRTSPLDLCLIIDEFPTLPSADLEKMLEQTGKYGLHLFLAHQEPEQIQKAGMTGAIKNAQVKMMFRTEDNPRVQRHFTLRRTDHTTVDVETPEVKSFEVSQARFQELVESLTKNFLTIEQVDELLVKPHNEEELTDEDFIQRVN
jgi:type IV secretory pathway TraG/TraD family ATPase VirD4